MYSKLKEMVKKPAIYTRSKTAFWEDAHISLQMLQAHLDPESDAASRRIEFIDRSVEWIKGIAAPETYKKLLDLGCGPGLYAERFAEAGYSVTGVDLSSRSIRHAERAAQKNGLAIRYLNRDYLDLQLEEPFDLITMIYCDYGALLPGEREKLLRVAYGHLKPGGLFLFDVFSHVKYDQTEESMTWENCPNGGFWKAGEYIALHGRYKYPDYVTLDQYIIVSPEGEDAYYIWDRAFNKEAIVREAEAAGFTVRELLGDVAGKAYDDTGETIAVLLEKYV